MISGNDELMKYILDDVQKYKGFRHFVKASYLERHFVTKLPTYLMHPNPDDEFSKPEIGPHFGIINEYCKKFALYKGKDELQTESLVVEKMSRDGYMILNGHHRWAAAMKMGIKKLPVQIVNLTHEEDHRKMLEKTTNDKRVIFDFDEVLCVTEAHAKAEEDPRLPFGLFEKMYSTRLRWGVPELIQELQRQNYDVWIYTRAYHSLQHLQGFFKTYRVEVDGIINGYGHRRSEQTNNNYRELMAKKYKMLFNVDNDGILKIYPGKKEFESYDLETTDRDWTGKVMEAIIMASGDEK